MRIRTLIVDDEAVARRGLRTLLTEEEGYEVVGECGSGEEALEAIRERRPDVVLLDVRMPDLDGFEVLSRLGPDETPAVVFVTAYGDRALDAFRVDAVDYLLKPFDRAEFRRSMRRVRQRIRSGRVDELASRTRRLLERLESEGGPGAGSSPASSYLDRIPVRLGSTIRFVPADSVDWIEVEGNYVQLHVGEDSHLYRSTLTELEERLDPGRFLRISRSYVVNLDRIDELVRLGRGRYRVVLSTGKSLESSRRYRKRIRELIV